MSFTDQKPFIVDERMPTLPWGGMTNGDNFRCSWCGHRFKAGDTARWIFTNTGEPLCKGLSGNPFVCSSCDGPRDDLLLRLQQMREEAKKYWWFAR